MNRVTRGQALDTALLAGSALAGGMLLGGTPDSAESQRSAASQRAALNELLRLERIQVALYAEARDGGVLTGELAALAATLADHEAEHVAVLTRLLGSAADDPPALDFGRATRDAEAFGRAALALEDLTTQSYNVQIPQLRGRALREGLRIVSVEARHAAWIRDLRGDNPAPDAVEPTASGADVQAALDRTGFLR
jgi:Ferritin-like domain